MRFIICLMVFACPLAGLCQPVNVTGDWIISLPANVVTEAGDDYQGTLNSNANQSLIDLRNLNSGFLGGYYTIYVKKQDILWDYCLKLSVERTGNGSGGTAYYFGGSPSIEVSDADQTFFSIWNFNGKNKNNVPVAYSLSGYSVLIPVRQYSTNVVYTISN